MQELVQQVKSYNEMDEHIKRIETDGITLLDVVESASQRIYDLTKTLYPGVPSYVFQELKAVRASLAPYVAAIQEYNNRDVDASTSHRY